jgi:hypothetical protein
LPIGQGIGSERWITKPLPYGYDENNAALPVAADDEIDDRRSRGSGPIRIIKKTNFNTRQPAESMTKVVGDGDTPAN